MAMATVTPRRRSARIRSNGTPATAATSNPTRALGSLVERDETPDREGSSINALVTGTPGAHIAVKTPQSNQHLKPAYAEMHPSHVHQSTVKVSNAGLQFGFADINPYQSSPLRPSNQRMDMSVTPMPNPKSSPGYQFSFNRNETDLGEEAQRIMASVRDEAARIKEKMRQEREEQRRRDEEAEEEAGITGRRFAKPKSRYSDAHKAEFNKMESIANHISLWKTKFQGQKSAPQPEQTVEPAKTPASTQKTLKRSHSKVDLEAEKKKSSLPTLKRTQSKASIKDVKENRKPIPKEDDSSRLENSAPAKRRRTAAVQDVSELRPTSSGSMTSKIPTISKGTTPAALSTPTKSSLARSKSIQDISPSKLPTSKLPAAPATNTLHRSKSIKGLTKPSSLRTASGRLASAVSQKVNSVKSILSRPQPKYSDDPVKIAAGTHIPMPKPTPSHHDATPSLPGTPRPHHTLPRATPKKVEFAPDTKDSSEKITSPSPMKKVVEYPRLAQSIERSVSASPAKSIASESAGVPTPKAAFPTPAKLSFNERRPELAHSNPLFSNPPTTKDFTFTHAKRMPFSHLGLTLKDRQSSSSSAAKASIRHIRSPSPSALQLRSPIQVSPTRFPSPGPHKILAVPHGINSKKRARPIDVDSSDYENVDPKRRASEEEQDQPRKRAKVSEPPPRPSKGPPQLRQTGMPPTVIKKRQGISLSRLNFLASPKVRR